MPEYIKDPDLLSQLDGKPRTSTPQDFAKVYGPVAERAGKALNIDPQLLLGQWGLETGWGKSIIPGTNNLGNIKDFSGAGTTATDNMTGSRDKYRTYESPEAFADDYASLIQRKYPGVMGAKDALSFATALKNGGYAEDPKYVDKVVQATRMATPQNPVLKAVGSVVESVIPSAQAAERQYIQDPELLAQLEGKPAPKRDKTTAEKVINAVAAVTNPAGGLVDMLTGGKASIGAARGAKDVIDTGAGLLSKLGGDEEAARIQAMNQEGKQDFKQTYGDSTAANLGRLAGNVAITYPVGGIIGAPLKAAAPAGSVINRLGTALATSGASTGAPVAAGFLPAAGNMLLRMAGGAGTGAASAALIDPESAKTGAIIGAAMPPVISGVGKLANMAGSLVRPFTSGGQQRIAGNVLREFAADPQAARNSLLQAREIVPGSAPTAATASGDAGIAAVTRSMEGASPSFAADMAARQTAQNQARTAAMEGIAGNTGKIDLAKAARDATTGPMREQVLEAAGMVPTDSILKSIDRLIAKPDNAGKLSQQALNEFRKRIADLSSDGTIDARALYEVRKDINTVLGGKLQGEAGNLRYAAGQLGNIKSLIDDAIDAASRRVAPSAGPVAGKPLSTSREIVPFVPSTEVGQPLGGTLATRPGTQVGQAAARTAEEAVGAARPTWRGYLQSYAEQSIPIRQMERLDEILKSVQTGTVDAQGGAILSAAKLNNLLKNQGSDLAKELSPQQLQILRNIQADLNAGQIASNVAKAGRSDTFQNFSQNKLLQEALGRKLGGSTAASATLGRLLQLPYGTANKQIQERLGNALLNPQEAAALLAEPQGNALLQALTQNQLPYKAAPAISSR